MIPRLLKSVIDQRLKIAKKAIIIVGPRQTGKTTLLKEIVEEKDNYLFLDGDDPFVREQLTDISLEKLKQVIGKVQTIFIDEAQRISNIGITLKLITDNFPECQLFVTGSSALELGDGINEPLTGRKWELQLFPISWAEFQQYFGYMQAHAQLDNRILYGMYPEVINAVGYEREVLIELMSSYLYKDVLSLSGIRRPEIIERLLKALALQVGQEVSYNELSNLVGADKNTIINYINILEKTFVIFRLSPFSRNLRNEISTTRKIYFYDNGLLNAVISNFMNLENRNDKGALWENFLISERKKHLHYSNIKANTYFWRTKSRQEIDYIEERDGIISSFEFKFKPRKVKPPITFTKAYPNATFEIISKENFLDFLPIADPSN
ncbi:ATP-binding protein [Ekhidna sp.]|uniref:ATP-binding protein n=1 Tax=Ekhidna sp. TaxID=2608089 RepID=UPI003CCBB4F9